MLYNVLLYVAVLIFLDKFVPDNVDEDQLWKHYLDVIAKSRAGTIRQSICAILNHNFVTIQFQGELASRNVSARMEHAAFENRKGCLVCFV